jgi:hypothetical protein
MDCKTATKVYASGDPLVNIQGLFPETWAFLETQVRDYVAGKADKFDSDVRSIVGPTHFKYRMTHRDDRDRLTQDLSELLGDITSRLLLEKHFSAIASQPLYFSTICCSSHLTADHELTLDEVLPLQKASVQLQPVGA